MGPRVGLHVGPRRGHGFGLSLALLREKFLVNALASARATFVSASVGFVKVLSLLHTLPNGFQMYVFVLLATFSLFTSQCAL